MSLTSSTSSVLTPIALNMQLPNHISSPHKRSSNQLTNSTTPFSTPPHPSTQKMCRLEYSQTSPHQQLHQRQQSNSNQINSQANTPLLMNTGSKLNVATPNRTFSTPITGNSSAKKQLVFAPPTTTLSVPTPTATTPMVQPVPQTIQPPIPSPAMLNAQAALASAANGVSTNIFTTPIQSRIKSGTKPAAIPATVASVLTPTSGHKKTRAAHTRSLTQTSPSKKLHNWMSALSLAATGGSFVGSLASLSHSPATPISANSRRSRPTSASPSPTSIHHDRFIPDRKQLTKAIALLQTHNDEDIFGRHNKENNFKFNLDECKKPESALEKLEREEHEQKFQERLASSLLDVQDHGGENNPIMMNGLMSPKVLFSKSSDLASSTSSSHSDHQAELSLIYRSTDGHAAVATIDSISAPPTTNTAFLSSSPNASSHFLAGVQQSSVKHLAQRQAFISPEPYRVLDCPGLLNDYYLNLVHWSAKTGVLAIALGLEIYLWNQLTCVTETVPNVSGEIVTSVRWNEDGTILAVGYKNGETKLHDIPSGQISQTMKHHQARVSAIDWNTHSTTPWIFASSGLDTTIKVHDGRQSPANYANIVASFTTHTEEVCGLSFSQDGLQLASGGNDNKLCIWNLKASLASHPSSSQVHRNGSNSHLTLTHHHAAVKALAWCPWTDHLLASGGGLADGHIRFCDSISGNETHHINTSSQVCSLQWSLNEKELLSAHGHGQENSLILWKFPELTQITQLKSHSQRVLHTAISPDGSSVVSAAGDETLRFWKVWKKVAAPAKTSSHTRSQSTLLRENWMKHSPMHKPIR